ncbi:hypothetical protein AAFF_G00216440 [Aldrovandia affinis]|uniref:Cilia- and flagella-associated protein 299 n=1 Tax=Aldrovandia affinis TaxID=143900 RepID=A0AAD7RGH3_9TELE|nr:hypothetical protein AAFF_G00216440 [Aldrovandia affinis]
MLGRYGNHTTRLTHDKMGEERTTAAAMDTYVPENQTYEDYLSSKLTAVDLFYLEDEVMARQLVGLGCIGHGEVLKKEEFEKRKAVAEASRKPKTQQKTLASAGKTFSDNFLRALAEREEPNRSGRMASIIFIRDRNGRGQEISAYIDYAHRLQTDDFEPIFNGDKKLLPKSTDLSFFNWETDHLTSSDSPNYKVIDDDPSGMVFKNKLDRKIVDVNLKGPTGDSSSNTPIQTSRYMQVVIFDHVNRRRN